MFLLHGIDLPPAQPTSDKIPLLAACQPAPLSPVSGKPEHPDMEPFPYAMDCKRICRCLNELEVDMGFGRGILLWLLGVPIPIILLIALFWHH